MKKLFTSESVTEGHPDKICDYISDSILDACLEQDPDARVAAETSVGTDKVFLAGEISTKAEIDLEKIVRDAIKEIGYTEKGTGFDDEAVEIIQTIDQQSPDIAQGVDQSFETREEGLDQELSLGAGDQGLMFGYATNETEELMPLPISLAHKLTKRLAEVRKEGILDYLKPDGKGQVTVEYEEDLPKRIDTIVLSAQHAEEVPIEQLREDLKREVIDPVLKDKWIDDETKIFINPTGRFVIGGPHGDAGLTGRKIIVDTYGGMGRHGGGAFSGKDATKVDRSATYAARWIAKNIVSAGLADKVEVQIAYSIGVAEPVSINVNTFGTGKYGDEEIAEAVSEVFDLRPQAIIETLELKKPGYAKFSNYGHFGREELGLKWEETNKADELKEFLKESSKK